MNTPRPISDFEFSLLKPVARWMSALHTARYLRSRVETCLVKMNGANHNLIGDRPSRPICKRVRAFHR